MPSEHAYSKVISISFLVAFLLATVPLPEWIDAWRPAWVVLVFTYWCMALPDRINIGTGWLVGLLLDVQQGTLLGQNALSMVLIAYFVMYMHKRLRVFPLLQQSLLVGLMVVCQLFLALWIMGMIGTIYHVWSYWLPAVSSMILWPWLFRILRNVRRQHHLT